MVELRTEYGDVLLLMKNNIENLSVSIDSKANTILEYKNFKICTCKNTEEYRLLKSIIYSLATYNSEKRIQTSIEYIKSIMVETKDEQEIIYHIINDIKYLGDFSDGDHSFNELYHHRAILFSVICNQNKDLAWKSKKHADGTMFDNMFVVGINTPMGQATYHYYIDPYWDMFHV